MPSDDPAGTEIAMRLETTITETEQYIGNTENSISWLNATDSALNQISARLHRARELVVYGGNGTLSPSDREAVASEVDQLLHDVIQVANSKHGHKFLFSGENTLTEPFTIEYGDDDEGTIVGVTYQGTSGDFSVEADPSRKATLGIHEEIGPGINIRISVHGDDAVLPVIESLIHLRDKLRAGDTEALSSEDTTDPLDLRSSLQRIDDAIDTVLRWRAETGARVNRLELVSNRLNEVHTNLNRLLSESVDVDVAETVMNLKMEENVYRMALASGARIIQPTLMDFLR